MLRLTWVQTTTLLELAQALVTKGHRKVNYLVYNKAAKEDAARRFRTAGLGARIKVATVDSAVFSLDELQGPGALDVGDHRLKVLIRDKCGAAIGGFLNRAARCSPNALGMATRRVERYIFTTFLNFLQGAQTADAAFNPASPFGVCAADYSAVKHYRGEGRSSRLECEPGYDRRSRNVERFLCEAAREVWVATGLAAFAEPGVQRQQGMVVSWAGLQKVAQLRGLLLEGTAVLADEVQDLNPCQGAFITAHAAQAQLFLVGDFAQCIYTFRGARPDVIMGLQGAVDRALTTSFRFGPRIAAAANVVLFAKEHSPQTPGPNEGKPLWVPYRIRGGASFAGQLLSTSRTQPTPESPVTYIARCNATLVTQALELLKLAGVAQLPEPRMYINSVGGKFSRTLDEVRDFLRVYEGEGASLPPQYEAWAGNTGLTWKDICEDVTSNADLHTYLPSITLINTYGAETRRAIDTFESKVLKKQGGAGFRLRDADAVLTTAHGAKGMEWDTCEVLGDFIALGQWNFAQPQSLLLSRGASDEVNLLYVAITRAKRQVVLPQRYLTCAAHPWPLLSPGPTHVCAECSPTWKP